MERPTGNGDTLKEVLRASVRSTGFWSAIAAIVGVIAAAAGGILQLTIEETSNFSVSVLVIGLVLLFVALVLSPRAVALFMVGRQGRYGTNAVVMTAAFLAIFALLNFLMFRATAGRFDVTATRVFTLAQQTVQVLDDLDVQVRANAFFVGSQSDPVREGAEDLLNEFARRTSNFEYRFVDPEFSKSIAVQYDVTEYPSIVFESIVEGKRQLISALTEQEFVTGILVATGVRQKRVYFLTGHDEAYTTRDVLTGATEDQGFDFAVQGMQRDNYLVLPLNLSQIGVVPNDAAVLVIAGPQQNLDSAELEALTEYVTGESCVKNARVLNTDPELCQGGRLIVLTDPDTPVSVVDFLAQWGVVLGRESIADAISNVGGNLLTPLLQRSNVQYSTVGTSGIVDQLDVTFFPDVTSVGLALPIADMPPHIRILPLGLTTPVSWLETDVENVRYDQGEETLGPFLVAATVEATGTLDGSESHEVARFVVFGDSDFAKNRFFYSNDNADFFLNSVNWLAEDFELISIRPKSFPFRQLVVNTREREFIKWSSWFVPPSVMILLGAFVWWRRR